MSDVEPVSAVMNTAIVPARKGDIKLGGISENVVRDYFSYQSASSEEAIRLALRRMAAELGILPASTRIEDVEWHNIKPSDFSDLMYFWRNRLGAVSVRRYLSALRGICRSCFFAGTMSGDVYARIREIKFPKGSNRVGRGMRVERKYQKKLLDNCMEDDRIHGVRDAAILAALFGTGIRRAEAVNIRERDIDMVVGKLVVTVKGGNTESRYIAAWALPYIQHWIDVKAQMGRGDDYLFVGITKSGRITGRQLTGRGILYLLEERSNKAGLPFIIRPHDARRTMGTEMIEEHGELIAQRVLGHASLNTTRIYDKRSDSVIKDIMSERK